MKMTRNEYRKRYALATPTQRAIMEEVDIEIEEPDIPNICPDCNNDELEWHDGYPGESLLICTKCHKVVYCDFDISAII